MNGLGAIACGAGLQDGLNPCIFMTCAVFITYGIWLERMSLHSGWWRIVFMLAYASSFLEFNFGPAQIFLFNKDFIFAAKILYFVLGVWAFILGVLFFKDWFFLLRRGLPLKDQSDEKKKPWVAGGLAVYLTIILAVVLSALSTLWPINNYVMLLGNGAFLKGQWQSVIMFLTGYIVISMWPLWFVWAFLSVKSFRPSFLRIVCASVFFTASSCVIFIFK